MTFPTLRLGLAKVADLTDFAEIITGPGLSAEIIRRYRAAGARITIVEDAEVAPQANVA